MSAAQACVAGLAQVFSWPEVGLLVLGVVVGALVGILPGLGGSAALAILMPFTLGLPASQSFALLIGVAAVVATTGDLTSILLGIPGEGVSAATVVDGHRLTLRGQAARALGASLVSSLAGSMFGALTLALAIPFALALARSIASPELFMLTLIGITFLTPLSAGSPVKGMIAGGIGVLLATVGLDPLTATPRFTFGQLSLWDGVGAIPVALGLYAIPEVVQLSIHRSAVSSAAHAVPGGLIDGVRDARRQWPLVLHTSALGTLIGMIPGVGANVAQWVAYGYAARRKPEREAFGEGAIEGVIAPSAANNATLGGSLIPALALGLPGGILSALLLTALIMKGLTPGPMMLVPESLGGHLSLVFTFVGLLVLANVMAVTLAFASIKPLTLITHLPGQRLVPFLIGLMLVGAFAERQSLADLLITACLGVAGIVFVRFDWPRAPMLMGVVLAPLAESRLFLSMDAYGLTWLWRPGVLLLAVVLGSALVMNSPRRGPGRSAPLGRARGETAFALTVIGLMLAAWVAASHYDGRAGILPRGVAALTIVFVLTFLFTTRRAALASVETADHGAWPRVLIWIPIFIALVWAFGFVIGVPLAVFAYSMAETRERWSVAAWSSTAMFVFLYAVLQRLLSVPFPSGVLLAGARVW